MSAAEHLQTPLQTSDQIPPPRSLGPAYLRQDLPTQQRRDTSDGQWTAAHSALVRDISINRETWAQPGPSQLGHHKNTL